MLRPTSRLTVAACLCLLPALGCGPTASVVSGTVTLEGTPVDGGLISFMSEKGQVVSVDIQSNGTYAVPALPHGKHLVTVFPKGGVDPVQSGEDLKYGRQPAPAVASKEVIPGRYGDAATSGLSCVVTGSSTTYDVPLTK